MNEFPYLSWTHSKVTTETGAPEMETTGTFRTAVGIAVTVNPVGGTKTTKTEGIRSLVVDMM